MVCIYSVHFDHCSHKVLSGLHSRYPAVHDEHIGMRPHLSLIITAYAAAFVMRPAVRSGHGRINSIADDLVEHDVVEYTTDDGGLGLGVVCEDGSIHPLCYFVEDEEEDAPVDYVWDEEVDAVEAERAVRVVDDVYPKTRQAQRGVDNPHGEHAEDVYEIERGALDERVVVAFRPERDIVWG